MKNTSRTIAKYVGLGLLGYLAYDTIKGALRRFSLEGKVVLISGGSRGLGFVLANQLVENGASVCLLARNEEELKKAQNLIQFNHPHAQVIFQVCDSAKPEQAKKAVRFCMDHFKRLDVVINNAGVISVMPYVNATEQEFRDSLDVHFWAPFNIIEAARPYLIKEGGRIVNISSIGGRMAVPHLAPYCAGKFALAGYSQTLRAELMKDNIYVTTVFPGLMRTGSQGHAEFKGQHENEFAWFSIAGSMPLLTVSAESAARQIIRAMKYGKAELTISLPAKLAIGFQHLFPEIHADLLALTNSLLPTPSIENTKKLGMDSHSTLSPSVATRLSEDAARRNNEQRF
ncbi:MAG: hypothetical protein OM95_16325 [Bdellovibrio sp. ArHS]|uniref:SDR family NAD(P)-dependent oxidoreductase n=1 Tax=Bdellovibrio sp. ArHS TaxID=1569284 RepID=UPI000583370F|nr:SDR family NAD(P)-dependent oxidoreductase [Bdellovibrio sp. ArHS]KHD87077.1 MAG: hypothetical protein OM95_16325 [Bdellovibrio sp. ArHS]